MPARRLHALVVVLLVVAGVDAQTRRPIRETDLLDFVWTADPQIAPDGKAVAFVRVTVDRERDTYASSIWVVPADGGAPRAMTSGRRDTHAAVVAGWTTPRLSSRRGERRAARRRRRCTRCRSMAVSPRPLTSMPEGVTTFDWAPDGAQLVVGSNVRGAVNPMPEPGRPRPSDARIVSRARFRADGTGFLDAGRRSRLFFVTLRDEPGRHGVSRPIGQGRLSDQDAVWSPDGTRVYFTAETAAEPDYAPPRVVLMEATADGGPLKEVAAVDGAISRPVAQPRRHASRLHRRRSTGGRCGRTASPTSSSSIARRARSPISPSGTTTTSAAA